MFVATGARPPPSPTLFLMNPPSELDPESYTHALANVTSNVLKDRIRVVKVGPQSAAGSEPPAGDMAHGTAFGFDRLFAELQSVRSSGKREGHGDDEDFE